MKAVRFHTIGGPEVLQVEEVETPTPGSGEILIKVAAAGINYADLMIREGNYPVDTKFPAVLGFEVAGTVAALGAGVQGPPVGTRVVAGLQAGGYAEYAVTHASQVIPIPDKLDFAAATALYVQGLTAYGLLYKAARFQAGESVLVHAAAGGLGSLAVQLAKHLGAGKVIATASNSEKLALARRLGADVTIDYGAETWTDQVLEATDGKGVDVVLEMVGGRIGEQSLQVLNTFGRLVVFGAASGQPTSFVAQQLLGKNQSVIGFSLRTVPVEWFTEGMKELLNLVVEDRLEIIVGDTFPLAEAAAAHRAIAERRTTGKVVLVTGD